MNTNKDRILEDYSRMQNLYLMYSFAVKNILEQFLNGINIRFQLVSNRVKNIQRLSDKIDRKQQDEKKEYKKLADIEDLAGIRIVFYLESDKNNFLAIFREEFRNSISSEDKIYNPGGYRGTHIIFKLDDTRAQLAEYKMYQGLKCEIQVTSALYHAWSEVEHDIIYKPQGDPELLKTLGLDEIEATFEKLMTEHLQAATIQLDYINSKYAEIRRAGEILGRNFVDDISASKTNDELYNKLEVIEKFYFKKPEEVLAITKTILKQKPIKPSIIYHHKNYIIYGKEYRDVILKSLDVLRDIRYFKPEEILEILAELSVSREQTIREKALDIVKMISEYNLNIVKEAGYGYQRTILDKIVAWPISKRKKYYKFIETAIKELFSSTMRGQDWSSADTIELRFSAVVPNDALIRIRRDAIDLAYNLFTKTIDVKNQLRLINALEELTRAPSNVAYSDDLTRLIVDDSIYLVDIYRNMLYPNGVMAKDLAITLGIEKHLDWFFRSEWLQTKESEKLRADILKDELYKVFKLLVGDHRNQENWRDSERRRTEEIDKLVKKINKNNIQSWADKLNMIASQRIVIEQWQFQPFKIFLQKLAFQKPFLSREILFLSLTNNLPLSNFVDSFLNGFREANELLIWDEFLEKTIETRNINLAEAIVISLNLSMGADSTNKLREKDIEIIEQVVDGKGAFAFLSDIKENRALHSGLFDTLLRNYNLAPKRFERLIFKEIKNNPQHRELYFGEIPFALHRKSIDIQSFNKKTIELFKQQLYELPGLDWHAQEILIEIGKRDFGGMMDVFLNRINKEIRKVKLMSKALKDRYEAIPYDINENFSKLVGGNEDYVNIVKEWINKMSEKWSVYNWHVAHFLQRVGKHFEKIIMSLVEDGDDESLMRAATLMHSIEESSLELSIAIVSRTDNKKIIDQVVANIYATGVVSGEYGLADAYKSKADALVKYKQNDNQRVKKFAIKMIKALNASAAHERQRADEEIQLRKIEFEG